MLEKDSARFGILEVEDKKVGYKSIIVQYDDSIPRKRAEEINLILENKE